jgi:hypothetical protein
MRERWARRGGVWTSVAAAAILLSAGCSGTNGAAPPEQPTAASSPAPSASAAPSLSAAPSASSSDTPPATDPSATAADPSASAAPEQTLASRDFTVTGSYTPTRVRMRFSVMELKRRGELLDLKATLTNLEKDSSKDLRWQVGSRFQGSYRKDLLGTDGSFSGGVLTDVAGKKRYLVAADSSNACVCTVQLSSTFIDAGQTVELEATYAAPPATTTKLDVSIASLGTFRDLPVS